MDKEKAFEILKSKGVIDVNYNGTPVWIENISNDTNEVSVKDLSSEKRFVVDVSDLNES